MTERRRPAVRRARPSPCPAPEDRLQVVPVRTSRRPPRFKLAYPLTEKLSDLMPDLNMLDLPRAEFETAYRAKLGQIGVDALRAQLEAISAQHGGKPLALLCFEDVSRDEMACHRRVFARWWTEQTGEQVNELPAAGSRVRAVSSQPDIDQLTLIWPLEETG